MSDPRIVSTGEGTTPGPPDGSSPVVPPPYDPLRLCIYATIAFLGWAAGPIAVVIFAVVGFTSYLRARRAGLSMSRCFLRDTRLVLLYLGALVVAGMAGIVVAVASWRR